MFKLLAYITVILTLITLMGEVGTTMHKMTREYRRMREKLREQIGKNNI